MLTFSTLAPQIFGPSGAGKTTLLETIAGLRRPDTARISFMINYSTTAGKLFAAVRLRRLGYVPQYDSLFPHLSVERNLLFGSTASQKITHLSSIISSIFWTSDIYSIVTSVAFAW